MTINISAKNVKTLNLNSKSTKDTNETKDTKDTKKEEQKPGTPTIEYTPIAAKKVVPNETKPVAPQKNDVTEGTTTPVDEVDVVNSDSDNNANNVTMSIEVVLYSNKTTRLTLDYTEENLALYTPGYQDDGWTYVQVYIVKTVQNEDGTTTKYKYDTSTGSVSTNISDIKTGKARLMDINKGKIEKSGGVLTTKDVYQALIDPDGKSSYFLRNIELMRSVNGFGNFSEMFLRMAQNTGSSNILWKRYDYANKMGGCNKVFKNYNETGYGDFIKQSLTDALSVYGYEPEWVRGYNFPENSALSKAISDPAKGTIDADMKNFVKNNIEKIKNGQFPIGGAFNSNKDLYYSIHGFNAIGGSINGTTLTLTLYDIYDFDLSYIDTLQNTPENQISTGTILNAAGAAAMQDGQLTPYYVLINVSIDLTKVFNQQELASLGIG